MIASGERREASGNEAGPRAARCPPLAGQRFRRRLRLVAGFDSPSERFTRWANEFHCR